MDVFVPALNKGRYTSGLFALCRYSLQPFAVGLLASGVEGRLIPFEKGDCRDYRTWLLADKGIKDERTELDRPSHARIVAILEDAAKGASQANRFEKQGNILVPIR